MEWVGSQVLLSFHLIGRYPCGSNRQTAVVKIRERPCFIEQKLVDRHKKASALLSLIILP